MNGRLEGKTAVIFGGAGRIGSSVARAYAGEGARVVLVDRNRDRLLGVKESLLKSIEQDLVILEATIDTMDDAKVMTETLRREIDSVDILVNCPAYISRASFLEHSIEEFDRQWHVNVRIVFMVSQAIARWMAEGDGGKIINLASVGGLYPEKGHSGHCTAKSAIIALSRVMALELASHSIQVNVVAPGPTETVPFSSPFYTQHPEILQRIEEKTPAGRIGHPEDHTGLMVFLASDESNWITGQVILSDGGLGLV